MNNPAALPLLIVIGGIAWNVLCEILAGRLAKESQVSPGRVFLLRQAGWVGLVLAIVLAIAAVFPKV